ncbi:MAG: hypothetical protein HY359_05540 [Candidatus Rokubacteria bacterium]|nr:hypothetical protein [Candidatus Rokubacteria bacterium]
MTIDDVKRLLVVGAGQNMHFFYPPLVMRLVEVVKGQWTSEEALQLTAEVTRRIGREPVVLRKELPGFLVTDPAGDRERGLLPARAGRGAVLGDRQGGRAGAQLPDGPVPAGRPLGARHRLQRAARDVRAHPGPEGPAAPRAGQAGRAPRPRAEDRPRLLRLLQDPTPTHPGVE